MINLFLFLAFMFLSTYLLGLLFEKARIPWIFSSLFLGAVLAINHSFSEITSNSTFEFLAQLGMYLLLFIIGYEINLKEIRKNSKVIIGATFFIISLEMIFGTLLIHYVFGYRWLISIIVALSFATVGEAVLIPILDELKLINSKFGQMVIGIGSIDDIIEILVLVCVIFLVDSGTNLNHQLFSIGLAMLSLAALTAIFIEVKEEGEKFYFKGVENLFLFIMFLVFLFIGIGEYADATALAALLSGVGVRHFVPHKRIKLVENEVKTMCYGMFAPIFFLWVGSTINIGYVVRNPLPILLVVVVSSMAKIAGTVLIGRHKWELRKSILLGIGLSVRFSTSIIVIKILYDNGLVENNLYTTIIGSSIIFTFMIPIVFSELLLRWGIVDSE